MRPTQPSRLKKLSHIKPTKLSSAKTTGYQKARSKSAFVRLSVMLLAGVSPAFVFYASRSVGPTPEATYTPTNTVPVTAVDTPASELLPTPTATLTESLSGPIADHFDYPVASPGDWTIQRDFAVYSQTGGGWHTGEDWVVNPHLRDSRGQPFSTISQPVLAAAAGRVLYSSFANYPCSVIVLEHVLSDTQTVYSVYSHIEGLLVKRGEDVQARQVIGYICAWPDDLANSHLHFEIRSFYLQDPVNGDEAPCASSLKNFPPGPGYWPICQIFWFERPADEGWIDPSDFIRAHPTVASSALAGLSVSATPASLQTPVSQP